MAKMCAVDGNEDENEEGLVVGLGVSGGTAVDVLRTTPDRIKNLLQLMKRTIGNLIEFVLSNK